MITVSALYPFHIPVVVTAATYWCDIHPVPFYPHVTTDLGGSGTIVERTPPSLEPRLPFPNSNPGGVRVRIGAGSVPVPRVNFCTQSEHVRVDAIHPERTTRTYDRGKKKSRGRDSNTMNEKVENVSKGSGMSKRCLACCKVSEILRTRSIQNLARQQTAPVYPKSQSSSAYTFGKPHKLAVRNFRKVQTHVLHSKTIGCPLEKPGKIVQRRRFS